MSKLPLKSEFMHFLENSKVSLIDGRPPNHSWNFEFTEGGLRTLNWNLEFTEGGIESAIGGLFELAEGDRPEGVSIWKWKN